MSRSRTRKRLSTLAMVLCAVAVSGCASLTMPRIDPTGQRFFADPPVATTPQYVSVPGRQLAWDDVAVTLSPRTTVAPIGSEVVLLAGVLGPDQYLRTNRRLEWSLAPGGVGHFVAVGRNGPLDWLLGDFNRPRKVDNTFAVGSTSRYYLRLDRGTPTLSDDVCVLRGQGWITLTSPVEGSSYVVVYAPEVHAWPGRTQMAMIHWVDAQWQFPPPAINPAGGRHVLTTSVTRHSNGCAREGWRVRYTIVDGPGAGFAPDGAATLEVPTDAAGQASVEIFQQSPASGTNKIAIDVIRPASLGGSNGRELLVGSGTTLTTWTAPELAIRKTGPAVAGVDAAVTYEIEVSNPGDLPTPNVVVTDVLPDALSYIDSDPPAEANGNQLQWRLGELGVGESRSLKLNCRVERQESITNTVEATADGGAAFGQLQATDSATTNVMLPAIDVSISGPSQATVGSDVTFGIVITNRSEVPATALKIRDRFDPGLRHAAVTDPNEYEIKRELEYLGPGESKQINVTFRVTDAGRLCHTVEVTGAEGVSASAEGCVTAVAAAPSGTAVDGPGSQQRPADEPPPAEPPPGEPHPAGPRPGEPRPLPLAQPSITVSKTGPDSRAVGETAPFTILLTNTGNQRLTGVRVVDSYDAGLTPSFASQGHVLENGALVWTLDTLPAGQSEKLTVHCRCQRLAARTCNRVSVTTQQGARADAEACLEIVAAQDGLTISASALRQPVAAGKQLTYEILVSNQGLVPQQRIVVVATVPQGLTPAALGTTGPPGSPKFTIDGQNVKFEPLAEIAPGQSVPYRVVVHTRQPGRFIFHAALTSQSRTEPLTAEATTEVF